MSGASASQQELQQEQIQFYQQGMQESQATFGEQQELLKQMEAVYSPILAKGPNQEGFSAAEKTALDAQATQGTATNYGEAARAVGENLAAEGGGNPLPSGSAEQVKEEVAAAAAGQEASEESQILQADYAQGYKEFSDAGASLSVASGQLNPAAFENAATSAGSAAETTAEQINQENNSWETAAIGAVAGLGSSAMTAFCPAKGTRYLMADGTEKRVENLKVGDQIMGIDDEPQTIEEIQSAVFPTILVRTKNFFCTRTSATHAFALPRGGFTVAARSLGKSIVTEFGPSEVIAVEPAGRELVFNIITDGSHTYRADGVWSLGVGEAERHVTMQEWNEIGYKIFKDRQKWCA